MNTAVPIDGLSTNGVSVECTGSACPGAPTVNAVSRKGGTDSQVEIVIAGIAGDACAAADQAWTVTYNNASGSWVDSSNVGSPTSEFDQPIFSFTNLPVTNNCTGSSPPSAPTGLQVQ